MFYVGVSLEKERVEICISGWCGLCILIGSASTLYDINAKVQDTLCCLLTLTMQPVSKYLHKHLYKF